MESNVTYGRDLRTPIFTRAEVDALRAEDKAAIERLTKDAIAGAKERDRAAAEIERLQAREVLADQVIRTAHKRLGFIGAILDKDKLKDAVKVNAIATFIEAQALPESCLNCGGPLDPSYTKICPWCEESLAVMAKEQAEAIRLHSEERG